MNPIAEDILMHYGVKRRSGRYPYGSGEDPHQHGQDFLGRIKDLKKNGWTETPENIMKEFGLTTTQYRVEKANAHDEERIYNIARAKSLQKDGLGPTEIGKMTGRNESTVRGWLEADTEARANNAKKTADFIREQIETRGMLDVGKGAALELGISNEKMKQALAILEEEGYPVYSGRIPQVTNKGKHTTQTVIGPKGTEYKEIYDFENVHSLTEYATHDNGETFDKFIYPKSIDSKRVMVRYADDKDSLDVTGKQKDGAIELRRGVEDLSLGDSKYSQVRILVDNGHYLKGMAVYSDDMPDGVDIVFNTNKKSTTPKMDVFKEIKDDPDNPFGSLLKSDGRGQSYYTDKNGKRQLSAINKTREEGDWSDWKDSVPSQFLSKQSVSMAKKQLNLSVADTKAEYESIMAIDNPTIRKHYLQKFSDECDSAAVTLQAAALPGQKYRVILPVNTLKDTECYAPGYENGTKVALVRYPHGGTFEIPILTVNNKNKLGRDMIGNVSIDGIGITSKIANQLSGADFDGDTVMCIPTHDSKGKIKIANTQPYEELIDFDTKEAYPDTGRPGMKYIKKGSQQEQREMGVISNLITDMTLAKASPEEMIRAVKHSMVVIDAGKHKLDYKKSEIDNNIADLKERYQRKYVEDGKVKTGGASTIISSAKSQYDVTKRQGNPIINVPGVKVRVNGKMVDAYDPSRPEGALIWKDTGDANYTVAKVNKRSTDTPNATVRISRKGKGYVQFDDSDEWVSIEGTAKFEEGDRITAARKTKTRTQHSTKMTETDDAHDLVSALRHPMEIVYADYANAMKGMANKARVVLSNTGKVAYSSSAAKKYSDVVNTLKAKLNNALVNAPREREAQRRANAIVKAKTEADPNVTAGDIKKASQQALTTARSEVGSISRRNRNITITDIEWEAIQAGAVSENVLTQILNNADPDSLRSRATPRQAPNTLTTTQINRARSLSNSNYTLDEIARKLGVSTTTVSNYLRGE